MKEEGRKKRKLLEEMSQKGAAWRAADSAEFALAEKAVRDLIKQARAGSLDAIGKMLHLAYGPPPDLPQPAEPRKRKTKPKK